MPEAEKLRGNRRAVFLLLLGFAGFMLQPRFIYYRFF